MANGNPMYDMPRFTKDRDRLGRTPEMAQRAAAIAAKRIADENAKGKLLLPEEQAAFRGETPAEKSERVDAERFGRERGLPRMRKPSVAAPAPVPAPAPRQRTPGEKLAERQAAIYKMPTKF